MKLEKKPQGRKSNVVVQELDNELLIYDLNLNKAFCMNKTSALVYEFCNGKNSITEIRDLLSKKLKTPVSEELVWLALDGLRKENLLEKSEEPEIDFGGLSRRQVLRKVGLASLVTLPLILSLAAPSSANAASLIAFGQNCTSSPQCATGNCTTGGFSICCAPGVDPLAGFTPLCANNCAPLAPGCCSGMISDLGPAGCGGAGNQCACS